MLVVICAGSVSLRESLSLIISSEQGAVEVVSLGRRMNRSCKWSKSIRVVLAAGVYARIACATVAGRVTLTQPSAALWHSVGTYQWKPSFTIWLAASESEPSKLAASTGGCCA